MPELIGAAPALDLMLTGRAIDARRARKLGLVDVATPRRHFENAVRQLLKAPPPRHKPAFGAAVTNWPVVRNVVASKAAKQVAQKARRDHYPAPYAIIELWRDFGGDVRNVPKEHPASIYSIFAHPTTGQLPQSPRNYSRFSDAADDIVDARIYEGIHFRSADEDARAQGKHIANWAYDHFLRPVH